MSAALPPTSIPASSATQVTTLQVTSTRTIAVSA